MYNTKCFNCNKRMLFYNTNFWVLNHLVINKITTYDIRMNAHNQKANLFHYFRSEMLHLEIVWKTLKHCLTFRQSLAHLFKYFWLFISKVIPFVRHWYSLATTWAISNLQRISIPCPLTSTSYCASYWFLCIYTIGVYRTNQKLQVLLVTQWYKERI